MARRHHLWEVDHRDVFLVVHKQVKLVEVTVDKAMLSKLDDEFNESVVYLFSVDQTLYIDAVYDLAENWKTYKLCNYNV